MEAMNPAVRTDGGAAEDSNGEPIVADPFEKGPSTAGVLADAPEKRDRPEDAENGVGEPPKTRPRLGEPTNALPETEEGGEPSTNTADAPSLGPATGQIPIYPNVPGALQSPSSYLTAQTRAALAMGVPPGFVLPGQFPPMGYGVHGSSVEAYFQSREQFDSSAASGTSGAAPGMESAEQKQGNATTGDQAEAGEGAPAPPTLPTMAGMPPFATSGTPDFESFRMLGGMPPSSSAFPHAAFMMGARAGLQPQYLGVVPPGYGLPIMPRTNSIPLAMSCDGENLSEYQILIRKQLELFEAGSDDVESNMQGRKKSLTLRQVGLRCRHCAHLPLRNRGRGAVYYPTRLTGVYQAAQNMASSHLIEACNVIDHAMKAEMKRLRERRDTASGGKQYWADGAQSLGLYETEDGRLRLRETGSETAK